MQKQSLGPQIAVLVIVIGALVFVVHQTASAPHAVPVTSIPREQVSASAAAGATGSATTSEATSSSASTSPIKPSPSKIANGTTTKTTIKKQSPTKTSPTTATTSAEVLRIENPYPTPPLSFGTVNDSARTAVVNILCQPRSGSLRPVSGSGVLIEPRGVILTNAHVAQYVLLSESKQLDFACFVRTGSPAVARWTPRVLYIPPVWVQAHAADITAAHPTGTGEHDYALLYVAGSIDGSLLPAAFPYLAIDTRNAIGFVDDQVLAASYPAEFLGGNSTQNNLYLASSVTTIKQLLTFDVNSVDALSLGGVIEAQSGSSGGAVVNAWDRLIGIITTTSEGATTADRDLRAISLSYISRDLMAQTGFDLPTILGGDPAAETDDFTAHEAPQLLKLLLDQITK